MNTNERQRRVNAMKAARREPSDHSRSISFWFALLSPLFGIAVGILALVLFHR